MVERALRGVVHQALTHIVKSGLPGNHHFYITFDTGHDGVAIPSYLREQYPDEMTIVLQHQFFGLELSDELFSVTLSFNNKNERLEIPLAAITTFADPSVNFALQFQPMSGPEETGDHGPDADIEPEDPDPETPDTDGPAKDGSKVVTLDTFRKK